MGAVVTAGPAGRRPRGGSDLATTVQTLRSEEAARASAFGRVIVFLNLACAVFVPFLPGERWLTVVMMTTTTVCGVVAAWVWVQAARPGRYDASMFRVFGVVGMLSVMVSVYYAGVFSAGAALLMLAIFFFGQGDDRAWALGLTTSAVAGYVAQSVLVTAGVIPELGLMRGLSMTLSVRAFVTAMVPFIFGITIWQARVSRKATSDAVQRLGAALRAVQEREALLQEANQNFDAMVAAGGGHGGYSGRQAGEYLLGRVIGRGGMGEVYAATHVASGQRAAVKLLTPTALADHDLFQRFMREADILRSVTAPNVIALYGVGEVNGAPYIAMELLEGHDLAWFLRHSQKLSLAEAVELVTQVARGLTSAHAAGIVHRDLKPQNLFRTESSTWKILDFGVAKLLGSEGTLTHGAIVGTPGYMSPEQARGEDAGRGADIFSLGAVVYRVVTGRPPFAGADVPEAIFQLVLGTPARPSELVPGLPPEVDDVLAIALAKQPGDRFASAAELADAFRAATAGQIGPELRRRAAKLVAEHPWGHRAARTRPAPATASPARGA